MSDAWCEESRYLRRVKRIGVVGSDDINEISWKLSYGNREIAEGANLKEDSADLLAEDMQLCSSKLLCLPGEEMAFVINGTVATTALTVALEIEEVAPPRRRFGRGRGGRWGRGRGGFRRFRRRW